MNPKLQDSHTVEVKCFVQELRGYITPESVRVIVDIGSRNAIESITLKGFYPDAIVYAFECNPPSIEICRQNIGTRADIIMVAKAVSDVNGTVDFFAIDPEKTVTTHADGNIGASSLFIANPEYPHEKYHQNKIMVESITLEKWAVEAQVRDIDIMWIDLQGAELKAFKGMGNLISRVKVIYTEVEFKKMYLNQPLFGEIDSYLIKNGFILVKLYPYDWFGNALYVRKDLVPEIEMAKLYFRNRLILWRLWLSQQMSKWLQFGKTIIL
jgi:FkbM family methyltransferase